MTKFSLWNEEEEEEVENEEFFVQNPKKRRMISPPSTSQSNVHNQQQQANNNDDDNGGETDSTARSKSSIGGPISFILSDPDVLDCSICFEPLTIPVFQCDNGHIACSSCCKSLSNKCPSCCEKIGNNRCRAIEKVIESIKVSCCYITNGCNQTINYSNKHKHEENCTFAPCSCPFTNCPFLGSPKKLSHHMCKEHSDLVIRFGYNSVFSVSMKMDEKFLVLQEEKDGVLFILSHGNTVAIRCIDSSLSKKGFKYDIGLHKGSSSLQFQSAIDFTTRNLSTPPSMNYITIPDYFYTSGLLRMEICVCTNGGRKAPDWHRKY